MSRECSSHIDAERASLPPSSIATQILTDDVWQLAFQFLTAREIATVLAVVCRRFFRLTVGDIAALSRFWRVLWLSHLTGKGSSPSSGGLNILIQSAVGPSSIYGPLLPAPMRTRDAFASAGASAAQSRTFSNGIGYTEVHFLLDSSLASTLHSPLLFTVPPLHVNYAPASGISCLPPGREARGHTGYGNGAYRMKMDTLTVPQRTAAFLQQTAETLVCASKVVSKPRSHTSTEQVLALLYAKALCFLHPRRGIRSVLSGPLGEVVHMNIFSANHARREGTGEECFQRAIELREVLQRSWETCYEHQFLPPGVGSSVRDRDGSQSSSSTALEADMSFSSPCHAADGALITGNALFDINVLTTRASKRTDVYQGIVTGLVSPAPAGLGIFFPICASQAALAEWRSREWETRRRMNEGQPHSRVAAAAEERVVMADAGWAVSRRYVMAPFFDEDDEEGSGEEDEGNGTEGEETYENLQRGQANIGDAALGEGGGGRRAAAQRKRKQAELKARRQAETFRAEEDDFLLAGVFHGSLCLNARAGQLPSEAGVCSEKDGSGSNRSSSDASSTSLAIETDSATSWGGSSHSSVDFTTHEDSGDVSALGRCTSHRVHSLANPHDYSPSSSTATSDRKSSSRNQNNRNREDIKNSNSRAEPDKLTGLTGILAPGALEWRTPTDHRIPPDPLLSQAVPFLFPMQHVAAYLYLLQHVTFTDVHHNIWEPDEVKCAVCARLISPTGDAVETRFFSSHLLGSYPRFYMKMSFTAADLPAAVLLKKMECNTEVIPSSSRATDSGDGDDSDGSQEVRAPDPLDVGAAGDEGMSATAVPPLHALRHSPVATSRTAATTTAAPCRHAPGAAEGAAAKAKKTTPLEPVAFPLESLPHLSRRRNRHRSTKPPTTPTSDDTFQAARARREQSYRHRDTLSFDAAVDLFCAGYGRVEVDIPPSISHRGLDMLRTVLGLPDDFPVALLWNVVVYASGLGPRLWASQLHQLLYHYKMTFTDAVERAFGLRACYGPLNGLRPREFTTGQESPRAAGGDGRHLSSAISSSQQQTQQQRRPSELAPQDVQQPPPSQSIGARDALPRTDPLTVAVRVRHSSSDSEISNEESDDSSSGGGHRGRNGGSPISSARSSDLVPSVDTRSSGQRRHDMHASRGDSNHGTPDCFSSLPSSATPAEALMISGRRAGTAGPAAVTVLPPPLPQSLRDIRAGPRQRVGRDSDSDSSEPIEESEDGFDLYSDPSAGEAGEEGYY